MSEVYKLLHDIAYGDQDAQDQAGWRLNQMGGAATEGLIAALVDSDAKIRERAAYRLSLTGGADAVEPLIKLLDDECSDVRWEAARALGDIRDPRAVEPLVKAFNSGLSIAAYGLGHLGDERCFEVLADALLHEDEDVRESAIVGLGNIDDDRVAAVFIKALHDKSDMVRMMAASKLQYTEFRWGNDPSLIEALLEALSDPYHHVRSFAASALGRIGGETVTNALLHVIENDANKKVRNNAIYALSDIGDLRAVKPLVALLQSPDDVARGIAVNKLADLKPEGVYALLKGMLNDEDSGVRVNVAFALSDLGDPIVVPDLVSLSQDPDIYVRECAIRAMEAFDDPRVLTVLINALEDESGSVRFFAAQSLSRKESDDVQAALLAGLERWDENIIAGAYDFFIRKGLPGSEATLIDNLNKAVDVTMAKDFAACGNVILEEAGRAWLEGHPMTDHMRVFHESERELKPRWGEIA